MRIGALLLSLVAAAPSAAVVGQAPVAADCATARECAGAVEAALAAESPGPALDLAWRAVQKGPKDDPGLMFLLARAQARAGRPQDAIVMIRRLAERGVATEAGSHPDLARMREMPDWPAVEALVARAMAGAPVMPPAAGPTTPATTPSAPTAARSDLPATRAEAPTASDAGRVTVDTATVEEASIRFSTDLFAPAGLAYDAVSRRFVIGDQRGRKLRVVGEGLDHAVDLVRAESAGFFEIRALAIDGRRGDLWVASSTADATSGTLHRIQLISGRPLQSIPLVGDAGRPVQPVDVAVADSGIVFVLDRDGRLLRGRAGATALEQVATLAAVAPTSSLALTSGDTVAIVTHPSGIVRLDLATGSLTPILGPAEVPLTSIERLRPHREGFIAFQRGADGQLRLVGLELSRNGRGIRRATTYDVRVAAGTSAAAFAVAGDEVSLVAGGSPVSGGGAPSPSAIGPPADLVVRRIRLR